MKLWEKEKTIQGKRNFQWARGREESIHTWEREKSFSEKERSDLFLLGTEIEEKDLLQVFQEKNVLYGLYSGRTERYSRTADCQSKNRSFGTFPKVYACWFEAVQCTDIKGTAGHVFQESLLKVEAVQQH